MKIYIVFFLFIISFRMFAQQNIGESKREVKYSLEAGTYISTSGTTPFWLSANQYGIVPTESNFITLRSVIKLDYRKASSKEGVYKLSKFDWGYGLNVVGNLGKEKELYIPEAYIKAKYGRFEIYAGRRKEIVGLVDTILTSGSYIWSGNALPIPKIQIANPDYIPLGFTDGFLSFKGSFAHGWFENSRIDVKDFYLHQKSLYFRLGKADSKLNFYGGFNHQAQWGGELLYPDPDNKVGINGKVGSSFSDFLNVLTGRSLAVVGDTTKNGKQDATNRSGNHLGTFDLGLKITLLNSSFFVYRQSIFEDGSLAYLNNIADGLNGLSINFKDGTDKKIYISKIVLEFLSTMSQGGIIGSDNTNARLRGQDDYFNNGTYINGWTYNNRIIGNPSITFGQVVNGKFERNIYNNRVETLMLGTTIRIKDIISTVNLINSINKGSYVYPLEQNNFSFSWSSILPIKNNMQLKGGLIFEKQTLSNANFGAMVSVVRGW